MKTVATTIIAPFSQEKGLVSKVFASIVMFAAALFLAVSLSGCFDGESKTASQGNGGSFLATDSSNVKLVLKPGMKTVSWIFPSKSVAEEQSTSIRSVLQNGGVPIKKFIVSGDSGRGMVWVAFGQIQSEVILSFSKGSLESIAAVSVLGEVTQWDPSFGNEARLITK